MLKDEALKRLQRQIEQINSVRIKPRFSPEFKRWHRDTEIVIQKIFGDGTRHLQDFQVIRYNLSAFSSDTPDSKFEDRFRDGLEEAKHILTSMAEEIIEYGIQTTSEPVSPNKIACIDRICDRFHLVVRQLRSRHDNRTSLDVEDEYDVQDLLHCLLHLEFEDIRAEEWTPSYAGASSRVDFLLKNESIVIEVKKTRKSLGARELGEQLLIDIGRYQAHPDCKTLVCFVYDPEARIANPRGIEADLTKKTNELDVYVFIRPKGI